MRIVSLNIKLFAPVTWSIFSVLKKMIMCGLLKYWGNEAIANIFAPPDWMSNVFYSQLRNAQDCNNVTWALQSPISRAMSGKQASSPFTAATGAATPYSLFNCSRPGRLFFFKWSQNPKRCFLAVYTAMYGSSLVTHSNTVYETRKIMTPDTRSHGTVAKGCSLRYFKQDTIQLQLNMQLLLRYIVAILWR